MEKQTPIFYAHSENDKHEKHLLSKHLIQTAQLAESFACQEHYRDVFRITGMLHDLGKYQPDFQRYLENGGKRGSVPHSSWGAGYTRVNRFLESSIAIDGHHKGLPDNAAWKSDTEPFKRHETPGFENAVASFIRDTGIKEEEFIYYNSVAFADSSQREAFIRYLFSALTDSDWLSTEAHFNKDKSEIRVKTALPIITMLEQLEEELTKKSREGEINYLRNKARENALQKAEMPCGFYSLALPTGMGKTLTSLAWALRHAQKNKLKRIIIVLPFINIIDQTAQILKNIFGEEWVLEHHSSYNENDQSSHLEDCSTPKERKKLACENWDYPIIVTTTVQFFESLFSNSAAQCRKIHNIAESVVIFDEVQTLPKEILVPTLQMLKAVQPVMRISFLFCTATQPAFEKRPGFEGIETIVPLVEDTAVLYEKTKRVEYFLLNKLNPINYSVLLNQAVLNGKSSLVIFNTKKATLEFYKSINKIEEWDSLYHLSTAMCPSHRKAVINSIKDDLKTKKKILVASTQLIEAGVDFDFPVVFRAMAPLEAVIQAAGRCNREGHLGPLGGKVYLFKLEDSGMPDKTYAACAGYAEELITRNANLLYEHDIFTSYYANVVKLYVDPDKYNIENARKRFDFEVVNSAYHLIKNATTGLFIYNYNAESKILLHSLEHKEFLTRDDYRKMQVFTVQVYDNFIKQNGTMINIVPQGFSVWYGNYNSKTGMSETSLDADKLIV